MVKSGGIATNIGVHFYDMLMWIFGGVKESKVHLHTHDRASGYLELERARVKWFLSINYEVIPEHIKSKGLRTYRSLKIENQEFEFSGGFTELHTKSYKDILAGNGFRIGEARRAIELVHRIRHTKPAGLDDFAHQLAHFRCS